MRATRDEVIDLTKTMVELAVSLCPADVEFSAMDATRSDVDFLAAVLQTAIDAGATTINVPDTVGYTLPTEYAALMDRLYEKAPGLKDVVLSVHCHNDLGLAVANSLAAVERGATQVEVAVNGLGERAGNAALEEIAMALVTRADILQRPCNLVTTETVPHQPHGVELHRADGAGQQGHRGQERVRSRVGHPPGRAS